MRGECEGTVSGAGDEVKSFTRKSFYFEFSLQGYLIVATF